MQINSSSYPSCSSCVHFDQDGSLGKCRKKTYRDWVGDVALMQCHIVEASDPACSLYRAIGQESLPLAGDDQLVRLMVQNGQEWLTIHAKLVNGRSARESLFSVQYDCYLKSGEGSYGT